MINQITSKNKWGGVRENSGRKKKYVRRFTFSVTKEVLDILSEPGLNISDFINECIINQKGKE